MEVYDDDDGSVEKEVSNLNHEANIARLVVTFLIFIALAFMMLGCVSANVSRQTDKETCNASYTSVLKDLSGVKMSACHAKGDADSSAVNIDALIQFLQALKGKGGV